MARPGVTYNEVAEAASHLLGQNKNPTIEQVRLFLGTGSSTTIGNHLKQWRAEQQGTGLLAAKENIPQELIAMLKGLWERVIDQSEMKIKTLEINYQTTINDLQQELHKYKTNNQRWQQLFNQWQQEKEKLSNEKLMLEEGVSFLQKEQTNLQAQQALLTQQLQSKQERIEELHQLHQQTQMNLEHYRESVREQRMIEQQQFEQQKQELQLETKRYQEQSEIMKDKISVLQQQQQNLQQTNKHLEQKNLQVNEELIKLQAKIIEIEKTKDEHLQTSRHWQNQYKETQLVLENKTTQLIDFQSQAKMLAQQLADVKQSITQLHDQNKLLGHEKWVLLQEKSQLEGQLKQMQTMISA